MKTADLLSSFRHILRNSVRNYERNATSQEIQTLLKAQYRDSSRPLSFRDVGFRRFSQFEEDGILLYIFAKIGERSRRVLEICAGDGRECMATNLILNHGWDGLLIDGNPRNVARGKQFFSVHGDSFCNPPKFIQAWITAETVNETVRQNGFEGEIDLLSIDIDGNDYWIWKALDVVSPRVCVIETNSAIPTEMAVTSPYDPNYTMDKGPPGFHSASLAAIAKLGKEKGFRLVGTHRYGFNAFLMRKDVGQDYFPEITVAEAHDNPYVRAGRAKKWPSRQNYPWQAV